MKKSIILVITFIAFIALPVFSAPSPQPITVELSAYQGEPSSTNRTVASYVSPGLSASFAVVANVVIS